MLQSNEVGKTPEQIALSRIDEAAHSGATSLYLRGISLTILPPEIGQLTNLTDELDLGMNQLTTLPAEIGRLKKLTRLFLSRNQFTTLPAEIGQLTDLAELYLSNNQLIALPVEIGQLTNLTRIECEFNQLTTLPVEIGQLINLKTLQLIFNEIATIPIEMIQLTKLKYLDLRYNKLSIPPEILDNKKDPTAIYSAYFGGNIKKLREEVRRILEDRHPHKSSIGNVSIEFPDAEITEQVLNKSTEKAQDKTPSTDIKLIVRLPLLQAKVLLIGQGGVGKTSLLQRALYNIYDPNQNKTEGISINHWILENRKIKTFGSLMF